MLGAVGTVGSEIFDAAKGMVSSVGSFVADYPLVAAAAAFGAYEIFGGSDSSNNPSHLGQNVDTKA